MAALPDVLLRDLHAVDGDVLDATSERLGLVRQDLLLGSDPAQVRVEEHRVVLTRGIYGLGRLKVERKQINNMENSSNGPAAKLPHHHPKTTSSLRTCPRRPKPQLPKLVIIPLNTFPNAQKNNPSGHHLSTGFLPCSSPLNTN